MNALTRVFFKTLLTIVVFIFFGGVFRGCAAGAKTAIGQSVGSLFALLIFLATLYGIWSYSPDKKKSGSDITFKKD